ncbi:MAG TPA: ATP synthase subunit I [Acidimicrobiales bacterium]|nr:ATP synthase subunit I [Acidimicrobiales bacterium]
MVNVFSHFSLPQISAVARRTSLVALGLAVVALAVSIVLGHPLVGLGVVVGLVMALANFRLIAKATAKATASERPDKRRPLVFNTLFRLAAITIVVFALVFLNQQVGFGALVGLALFQFALLANVTVFMLRDSDWAQAPGAPGVGDEGK